MTIVLNENEWAEEMIRSQTLGKKPIETMRRVARYYIDKGVPKREVRRLMDIFLLQCNPTASLPKWSDSLNSALNAAMRYKAVDIDHIDVTKPEMERIDMLSGAQTRRLAFTLLCLAKYWAAVNPNSDGWVNNKDSDIMRMANINTSIKRQSLMYYNLRESGLISFSKKVDNTNVRVCFMTSGETAVRVTDFRNLGYQYMMYHGGPFFVCQNCGLTERRDRAKRGPHYRYCRSCAVSVAMQQRANSALRYGYHDEQRGKTTYTVYMHEFPDGKVYVGSTAQDIHDRWKNGLGYRDTAVGAAIEEAGWENIKHYILYRGENCDTAKRIAAREIRERRSYLPEHGYNQKSKGLEEDIGQELPESIRTEVDGRGKEVA